jgi:hypothetical protein
MHAICLLMMIHCLTLHQACSTASMSFPAYKLQEKKNAGSSSAFPNARKRIQGSIVPRRRKKKFCCTAGARGATCARWKYTPVQHYALFSALPLIAFVLCVPLQEQGPEASQPATTGKQGLPAGIGWAHAPLPPCTAHPTHD